MKNVILSVLAALGISMGCTAQNKVKPVEPARFIAAYKSDSTAVLLDVRTPKEFAEGHINGACNINWLDSAAFATAVKQLDKAPTYYIYCRSGRRSNAAAVNMQGLGFKVVDMQGGILHWIELGMPVVK